MKRFAIFIGLLVLVTTFVMAQPGFRNPGFQGTNGFCGVNTDNLTEQQKADMLDFQKKMLELKKESIRKMIENGTLTKEQGDAALKRMEEMFQNRLDNGTNNWGGRGGRMGCANNCYANPAPQQ